MSWLRQLCFALVLGVATVGLAACDEGPAENAGEKVDKAVENMKDTVNPQGPAERVGEALDKAGDKVQGEAH